jgi:hypothetical protein
MKRAGTLLLLTAGLACGTDLPRELSKSVSFVEAKRNASGMLRLPERSFVGSWV